MFDRLMALMMSCGLLLVVVLATLLGAESHVERPDTATPSAPPTLPVCATEEGSGQALCTWDASTQGNGLGENIISGDCAPSVIGIDASQLCVIVHAQVMDDTTGADAVAECIMSNSKRIDLYNCLNAYI